MYRFLEEHISSSPRRLLILGSVLKELIEMVRKFTRQIDELFVRLENVLSNETTTDGFEIHFIGQNHDRHLQVFATVQFCCTKRHARRGKGEDGREEIPAHVQWTNVRDQLRVNAMQALQRIRMVDIEVADGQCGSTMASHIGHGQNQADTVRCEHHGQQTECLVEEDRFALLR